MQPELEEEFEYELGEFAGGSEVREYETARRPVPPGSPTVRAVKQRLARMSLSPGLVRAIQLRRRRRAPTAEMYYEIPSRDAMILAFKIPEAPYSDDRLATLHKVFEVIEGADAVVTIFESELMALLGGGAAAAAATGATAGAAGAAAVGAAFGLTLGVAAPIAGMLASFAALGAGYAEARAIVAKDRIRIGFAKGVVMGATTRPWKYVKELSWERNPERNDFDPEGGKIAQKAFNLGLMTGFVQGRKLSEKQKTFFGTSLDTTLTAADRTYFRDPKSWREGMFREWYTFRAASFLKIYAKD